MEGWLTPVLVFAGVVVSGLVTYFISKRNNSGSISTSDAASLWKESNDLRQEYRDRAEQLEQRLQEVNTKLQAVMEELNTLRSNSVNMSAKIESLKKIIAELQEENKRLLAQKGQAV
jgi:peptidoglycan hydrolase CwlO-like protein